MTTKTTSEADDGARSSSYMGRLLDLLEACVLAPRGEATMAGLAGATGIPPSTTSRLVSRLVEWGFLADDGRRFVAGPRLVSMSFAVIEAGPGHQRLEQATRELSELAGESVTAGSIMGNVMFITARTESTEAIRAVDRIGEQISPATSALGKAIMSWLPREQQLSMLRACDIVDPEHVLEVLDPELVIARRRRYAVDEETFAPGLRCRAAAILGPDGAPVGGLSIGGPTTRFTVDRADSVVSDLLRLVDRLSGAPLHS